MFSIGCAGGLFEQVGGQAHLALGAELAGLQATGALHLGGSGCTRLVILRAHIGQRPVQGAVQEVVHHAPVTKAHLVLGRVHVHVHAGGVDLQKQHEGRVPTIEQHVAVGLTHRVGDQLVAHGTAVDEEVLQVGLAAREGRQADPAPQMQAVALHLDRQRLLQKARAADRGHAPCAGRVVMGFMQAEDALAVVAQMEGHVEARQRQAPNDFLQMVEFGFFGLEELAPGRGIEEQVAHLDRGTHRMRCRLHPRGHVAAFGFKPARPGRRRGCAGSGSGARPS